MGWGCSLCGGSDISEAWGEMTDNENVVLEAVTRGRLICPFREELIALRDEAAAGPLTGPETQRLAVLERAYEQVEGLDGAFHTAMEAEDYTAAERVARDMLAVAEVVA